MDGLKYRLKALRQDEGLSLRAFAQRLEAATGFSVTHDSVRRYETGERRVPSEYLGSVCQAFDVSPQWLLFGRGDRKAGEGQDLAAVVTELRRVIHELGDGGMAGTPEELQRQHQHEWARFLDGYRDHGLIRKVILDSWDRSVEATVDARGSNEGAVDRVSAEELADRMSHAGALLDAARPHLRWLSGLCGRAEHAVCIVDDGGVVLEALGSAQRTLDGWRVVPGADWSERGKGTNGLGMALATGEPVAVLGAEHFVEAFHRVACIAAPISDPDGSDEAIGAIGLATNLAGADPFRMAAITYVAEEITRELRERPIEPATVEAAE